MGYFDNKNFNSEVFGKYMERIPRVKQNKLLSAGVLTTRNDLKKMFTAQSGGNYATVAMYGLLDGTPLNYDGNTNITATSTKSYSQSMIVTGRAKAWTEKDFSVDITSADFMNNIAQQLGDYWDDVDQDTMLSILKGIFSMGANDFTRNHTTDITTNTKPNVSATTLNTAVQRAGGDNKAIFKVAIMHSAVATNLENMQVLEYFKATDGNGMQRDVALATWNGRVVLVDDSVPSESVTLSAGTAGVYTITFNTAAVADDTISIDGIVYTCTADGTGANNFAAGTATATATAIETYLKAQYNGTFTVTRSGAILTLTQDTNGYGTIPSVTCTGTVTATTDTTTQGVAANVQTKYTTYILGNGAFTFCDCGAKVPYETNRNPSTNGGEDFLYTRQRKLFAPYGISFTKASMASNSPTKAELALGANWALVSSQDGDTINHKAIPIVQIISLG